MGKGHSDCFVGVQSYILNFENEVFILRIFQNKICFIGKVVLKIGILVGKRKELVLQLVSGIAYFLLINNDFVCK
ncbi:hypothetical protein D7322_17955 [Sphingobacterium puteale]|uniref:Uncharacterized protein n=1 Tax=Sphingobacterium puteale TaxID=2420510 RepID=A0A420VVJ0_9SPHI|nr:hypothetical protein D7322_17955 [Sphingobacterium puteale]